MFIDFYMIFVDLGRFLFENMCLYMGIGLGLLRIGLEYIIWTVRSIFIDRKSIYGSSVNPFLEKKSIFMDRQSLYFPVGQYKYPSPPHGRGRTGRADGTGGRD